MTQSPYRVDVFEGPCPTEEVTLADVSPKHSVSSAAQSQPALVLLSGLEAGRSFRLRIGRNRLGRNEDFDVVLDDDSVSRAHCEIVVAPDGGALVRDLGSTNGTMVDEEGIGEGVRMMADGELIRLSASVVLKYTWQDEVEEAVQRNLYNAAVRDGLTGVFNKRYLMERFEQEFAWATRNGRPLALVIFDLDHFKRVNDTFGHDAGDAVLREVAGRAGVAIRREDVLARYGGEEFVLLMRETDLYLAMDVSERIRKALRRNPVEAGAASIPITASIGIATSRDRGVETTNDLFQIADRRLYVAKQTGRDRLVAAD